jgi:hypothetical protein
MPVPLPSKWSPFFRLSTKIQCPSLNFRACYTSPSSHPPLFYHPYNIHIALSSVPPCKRLYSNRNPMQPVSFLIRSHSPLTVTYRMPSVATRPQQLTQHLTNNPSRLETWRESSVCDRKSNCWPWDDFKHEMAAEPVECSLTVAQSVTKFGNELYAFLC